MKLPAATESVNATLPATTGRRSLAPPTGSRVRLEDPLFFLSSQSVCFTCLSVPATPEDDLWAVTPSGGLSRRLTKLLPQTQPSMAPSGPTGGDDMDDEWELI